MESRLTAPHARNKELVIEELGDELLVYDLRIRHAHCLTPLAATVWRECDGKSRPEAIAERLALDLSDVELAIDELDRCALLDTPRLKKGGMSRRDFGLKVTKVAAVAAAGPVILSIAAPSFAASLSNQILCLSITPQGGTDPCSVCNNQGGPGSNSPCCCCHDPTAHPGGNNIIGNNKGCAADAVQCCCSGVNDWAGSRCTEPLGGGTLQNCPEFVAAHGCPA
jgi:hypothetical protein